MNSALDFGFGKRAFFAAFDFRACGFVPRFFDVVVGDWVEHESGLEGVKPLFAAFDFRACGFVPRFFDVVVRDWVEHESGSERFKPTSLTKLEKLVLEKVGWKKDPANSPVWDLEKL